MKRILTMVAAALMAATSVNAQSDGYDTKHEVGVFYGVGSASNIVSSISGSFSAAVGDQSSFWGPIGLEYYYHLSPVVAVGGVLEYAGCKDISKRTGKKDLTESFFTVMPSVKFNWLRKRHFGMYSGASLGVLIASISASAREKQDNPDAKGETQAKFMFQATAIGAEFGGRAFRGFVEAGIGEKGVRAGLRYKF